MVTAISNQYLKLNDEKRKRRLINIQYIHVIVMFIWIYSIDDNEIWTFDNQIFNVWT